MEIKAKLKKAGRKVKETVVEYKSDIVSGVVYIVGIGAITYVIVKTVQGVRAVRIQPEIDWDNVITEEEMQVMIDAENKALDEYRAAKAAQEERA